MHTRSTRFQALHTPALQWGLAFVAFMLLSWPLIGRAPSGAGGVIAWFFGSWMIVVLMIVAIQATAGRGSPTAEHSTSDEEAASTDV